MKILVTGFDPFSTDKINPAFETVKRLPDSIADATILKLEIPTAFKRCGEVVHQEIVSAHPDYVLNVGQAGGRFGITTERIAINLDDGRIADNDNYRPINQPIEADGATAYFTQLPVNAMTRAIRKEGLPSSISLSAGTYVCNHIMYEVQYRRATEFPELKAGFMHIPFLPTQVVNRPNMPSQSLDDDICGVVEAIKTMVEMDGRSDVDSIE